jgi:hypothetical protein
MKDLEVPKRIKGQEKPSMAMAEKLFPGLEFRGAKGGARDGRSDSILIALWAKKFCPDGVYIKEKE